MCIGVVLLCFTSVLLAETQVLSEPRATQLQDAMIGRVLGLTILGPQQAELDSMAFGKRHLEPLPMCCSCDRCSACQLATARRLGRPGMGAPKTEGIRKGQKKKIKGRSKQKKRERNIKKKDRQKKKEKRALRKHIYRYNGKGVAELEARKRKRARAEAEKEKKVTKKDRIKKRIEKEQEQWEEKQAKRNPLGLVKKTKRNGVRIPECCFECSDDEGPAIWDATMDTQIKGRQKGRQSKAKQKKKR
eukprot:gnl/TRDRNA2_/TRDRNA2_29966_c0_seq1.p1 gnl/TRDRNA2_/TRDRNA2_29966_c0~~gnl/TRDRNA2_/TRDRNA2_29966_c0_seq1.p1  ORF type:complete len:246 (+),score=45.16 gnl/TRDRNA2_/TRDRNA2_29966_c0_seq1:55-792(+)